jgi:KTSC domain
MSTWIKRIDHDGLALHIFKKNGDHYIHPGVPVATFEAMKKATSLGSYFNKNIRDKFPGKKASG